MKSAMKITVSATIDKEDVRVLCIKRGWYGEGDTVAFDEMISFVDGHYREGDNPSVLLQIAQMIADHSGMAPDRVHLEWVMYELGKVVDRFYSID